MDIGRSFRFVFKSQGAVAKWARGGLYTVLFFTVFFAFVVLGYTVRLLCDLLEGRDTRMPAWRPLGELFNEGLQPMLISLAYLSPAIALSIVSLYVSAPVIYVMQITICLLVSTLFPLSFIRYVIVGTLPAAFDLPMLLAFVRANGVRVLGAWLLSLGVAVSAVAVGLIAAVALAVPLAAVAGVKSGAVIGVGLGGVASGFAVFIAILLVAHIYAQMYRASKPFVDDEEGAIRASIVMPPSLNKASVQK